METAHSPHYMSEKFMKLVLLYCRQRSDKLYGFIRSYFHADGQCRVILCVFLMLSIAKLAELIERLLFNIY